MPAAAGMIRRLLTDRRRPPVKITPTPLTAALAGVVAALAWPLIWSAFGGSTHGGTMELVVATLAVVALPAHVFVVGISRPSSADARSIDTALLKRVGVWLAAAGATAAVSALVRT